MNVVYIKKIVKIYHAARFAHVMVEREEFRHAFVVVLLQAHGTVQHGRQSNDVTKCLSKKLDEYRATVEEVLVVWF